MLKIPKPQEFWANVEKRSGSGCWVWKGPLNVGYGYMPKHGTAHRIAWVLEHGPIPRGKVICHGCDNRACVRVGEGHLFIGTQKDNIQDAARKGRLGLSLAGHVAEEALIPLDEAIGRQIRELRIRSGLTLVELGRKAKPRVDPAQLSRLERGRTCTTPVTYRGLARALGTDLGVLFSRAIKQIY